jgi:lysylphosphatidylglycerol synthetase-like protein (DUF2156 family)
MSFREKSAWVMAAVMIVAGLYYADLAYSASPAGGSSLPSAAILAPYTIFVIVASVVAQTVMAIAAPKDANAPADERERPLLDRAGHWSGMLLAAGAVCALLWFLEHHDGVLLFHTIMASLIVSQIAEYALQVVLIRRS